MIDSMLQEGTDAALDDQVARPRPVLPATSFNLGGFAASPFRGIGGGVAKSIAFWSETLGAFGQVQGAEGADSAGGMFSTQSQAERKQSEAARQKLLTEGVDYSNEVGDTFRQRAADILPDPKTAHTSEQVVAGLFDFGTRAIGYHFLLGPFGPAATGGDVALEEADRLKQQGVDLGTRTKAGAVAGLVAGASVAVPLTGPTRLIQAGKGVAVGEAGIVGQAAAEKAILHAAGYDKLADTFDPFDPVALAIGAVPGVLGLMVKPATPITKPLRTEADMRAAVQFTPEEQARSAAFEASPANLRMLEEAIRQEKRPEIRVELEKELAKQRAAASDAVARGAVQAEPDIVPAARVGQVVDALDGGRLTPAADLAGREAHVSAVEMAADQMGRGEPVEVGSVLRDTEADLRTFMADSKVVDSEGKPLPVYHGTADEISQFDRRFLGETTAADGARRGFFFTSDAKVASNYAEVFADRPTREARRALEAAKATGDEDAIAKAQAVLEAADAAGRASRVTSGANVLPVYLRIKNPALIDFAGKPFEDGAMLRAIDRAQHQGRDGVIFRNVMDDPNHVRTSNVYVAFHPEQVRSVFDQRVSRAAAAADQIRAARTPPEPVVPRAPKASAQPVESKAASPSPKSGSDAQQPTASIDRAAAEAAALEPNMLVHLDGMDTPMRVGDLLERVRAEAADDVKLGKLLEVAAACELRS